MFGDEINDSYKFYLSIPNCWPVFLPTARGVASISGFLRSSGISNEQMLPFNIKLHPTCLQCF
jgi:hypothetical protein